MLETPQVDPTQLVAARDLILNEQLASVSLLQRHFRLGYGAACALMESLQRDGVVEALAESGTRELTPAYKDGSEEFRSWALSPYAGCDGGDHLAKTWVLGVEHGDSVYDGPTDPATYGSYSIAQQSTYRYNVQVFKLLTAIEGGCVEEWRRFAEREQPFVRGAAGYFKGNLYPYPCWSEQSWTDAARQDTGFASKERYRAWCRNHRFGTLASWIATADPQLIIATGTARKSDFMNVAFDSEPVDVTTHRYQVGAASFMWYSATRAGRLLVVLPHLSGSPLVRGHQTLQMLGNEIAAMAAMAAMAASATV